MPTITQQAHSLIATLPDSASWDDVVRITDAARFRHAVNEGIDAAEQGAFVSASQINAMFARWGVDVAA